jgi:hypothetical protein
VFSDIFAGYYVFVTYRYCWSARVVFAQGHVHDNERKLGDYCDEWNDRPLGKTRSQPRPGRDSSLSKNCARLRRPGREWSVRRERKHCGINEVQCHEHGQVHRISMKINAYTH